MADFPQLGQTNINPLAAFYDSQTSSLANDLSRNTLASRTQISRNVADSGTQDLTDRSTLRGLAGGLSSGDPNAVSGAAVLPGGPGAVAAVLPFYNQQSNATSLGDIRKSLQPGDPSSAVAPGGDAEAVPGLGGRESSNDPTKVNADGYSGMFQHGTARLADIGVYTPAEGESLKSNGWKGTLNIPGFPEVKTQADFLKSPGAQRAAMAVEVANTDQAIATTPGADGLNPNGLRAVAHLGGVAGMQKFVATGGPTGAPGAYNPTDSNGTRLSDYYHLFSQGGVPALQAAFGHPDGHPGQPVVAAAPGVTLAPDQTATAPGSVQVAGPGAPTASAMPAQPGTQGVDDVMARLRAGDPAGADIPGPDPTLPPPGYLTRAPQIAAQPAGALAPAPAAAAPAVAPPQAAAPLAAVPGHTGPLASMLPAGPIPIAPPNGLAGSGPTFMPAASSAPPPTAVQAPVQPAQSPGQPPPGLPPAPLVLLPNGLTQQQTTDFINLSNRRTTDPAALTTAIEAARQQNRTAQQQYFADTKPVTEYVGGQAITRSPVTGQEVGPRYSVPDTRRVAGDDENGMHVVRNADGKILSSTPTGAYKVATLAYDRDAKEIAGIADAGHGAQSDNIRIQAMRDALANPSMTTGSGGTTRAAMASFVQTYFPSLSDSWAATTAKLPDAAVAQEFSKLALKGAGTQERQVLGARGGYQAMRLFQATNPGLDLLPGANRAILGMQLIGNQADADYSQGAQAWFTQNEDRLGSEGKYGSLAHYDQQWQQQRQPQIYAAAMGALAGLPPANGQIDGKPAKGWATGLSDQEYQQALKIVSRADPSAKVNGKTGPLSMQPQNGSGGQAAPVVSTPVQHQNLAPGTTYVDPDGNTRMRR